MTSSTSPNGQMIRVITVFAIGLMLVQPATVLGQDNICNVFDFFPLMTLPTVSSGCLQTFIALAASAAQALPENGCIIERTAHCSCLTEVTAEIAKGFTCHLHKGCPETVYEIYQSCEAETLTTTASSGTATTDAPLTNLVGLLEQDHTPQSYSLIDTVITLSGLDLTTVTGPYTILAPTDAALGALVASDPELQQLVTAVLTGSTPTLSENKTAYIVSLIAHHVIRGSFTFTELKELLPGNDGCGQPIETTNADYVTFCIKNNGQKLQVESSGFESTLSGIVEADMFATNGVAHGIDKVLIPRKPPARPLGDAQCTDPQDVNTLLGHGVDYIVEELTVEIEKAVVVCVAGGFDCVQVRMVALGYTPPCSMCFEKYAWCSMGQCVLECFDSVTSARCLNCTQSKCLDGLVKCTGQPSEILLGKTNKTNVFRLLDDLTVEFGTFDKLLNKSDVKSPMIRSPGNFTLFAPNNDAFKDPYTEAYVRYLENHSTELAQFCKDHIIDSSVSATQIVRSKANYQNLNKFSITGSATNGNDKKYVALGRGEKVEITIPDIKAYNGFVHGVSKALLRPACNSTEVQTLKLKTLENMATYTNGCVDGDCISAKWRADADISPSCSICPQLLASCAISKCSKCTFGSLDSSDCISCLATDASASSCGTDYGNCTGTVWVSTKTDSSSGGKSGTNSAMAIVYIIAGVIVAVLLMAMAVGVLICRAKPESLQTQQRNFANPMYAADNSNANESQSEPLYSEVDKSENDNDNNDGNDAGYMDVSASVSLYDEDNENEYEDVDNENAKGGYMDVAPAEHLQETSDA